MSTSQVPHRPDDIEKARGEQSLRQAVGDTRLQSDVQLLLSTESGRRLATMLIAWCGVYRTVVPTSGERMAFENGQKDIGLQWVSLLVSKDPRGYLKLMEEYVNGH
jgi:hypothetical protein